MQGSRARAAYVGDADVVAVHHDLVAEVDHVRSHLLVLRGDARQPERLDEERPRVPGLAPHLGGLEHLDRVAGADGDAGAGSHGGGTPGALTGGVHERERLGLSVGEDESLDGVAQADALVRSGTARHVLVVGVERLSDVVDPTDRSISFLLGDGAGGVLVVTGEQVCREA